MCILLRQLPRGGFVAGSALRAHRGPVAVRTSSPPSLSSSARTLTLVVREEADQRTTGLDAAAWGVLLLLTHLHSLTISYPCDLAAGLAAWLIPRNVRALTLDYAAAPCDPVPFLNQLHPGGQPPELRYVAMPDLSPCNAPQSSSTGYRQCGLWVWACVLAHLAWSRWHDDSRVPVGVEKRVPGVRVARVADARIEPVPCRAALRAAPPSSRRCTRLFRRLHVQLRVPCPAHGAQLLVVSGALQR
ncbi:hypothetical protein B0H11DRAFT_2417437 [Mycena galericulata]|nr:hypothetical protein B0H11DRAFT_2417437 [Mycena galericulata]